MEKEYCEYCDKEVSYSIEEKIIKTTVLGVEVEAKIKCPICDECHNSINISKITKENEIAVYDAYKRKVGLLTSYDIKKIREKRNLSQAKFAREVSIGEKTLTRIENGKIQSKLLDKYLRLLDDDANFDCATQESKKSIKKIVTLVSRYSFKNNITCMRKINFSEMEWRKCHERKQNAAC